MKTVSLGLSQELKASGFPQETYFVYYPYENKEGYFLQSTHDSNYSADIWPIEKAIAAPTADEVLDQIKNRGQDFEMTYWKNGFRIYDKETGSFTEDEVAAEAAAKMYLFLKKEGLL